MNNRNQHRLLNDQQIKDITSQVAYDLVRFANESAEILVDHYLRGDAEGLLDNVTFWVEGAEDEVIDELNSQLNEDSFKQAQNDDFID